MNPASLCALGGAVAKNRSTMEPLDKDKTQL
jgi:hypothetical protein